MSSSVIFLHIEGVGTDEITNLRLEVRNDGLGTNLFMVKRLVRGAISIWTIYQIVFG